MRPPPFPLPFGVLFVGHRCSGKTTLGRTLSHHLPLPFCDLDDRIEEETGRSAADWVATDEVRFRQLERDLLARLSTGPPTLIASGAGLDTWPPGLLVLWIDREDWDRDAGRLRRRLRPDWELEREIAWMRETREPRYARAHSRLLLPRGISVPEAAELLAARLEALVTLHHTSALQRTWLVPTRAEDLSRAESDVTLLRLAGLEIRSDLPLAAARVSVPSLASLRTADPDFLPRHASALAFDLDDRVIDQACLQDLAPRRLILSLHDAVTVTEGLQRLAAARQVIADRWPAWTPWIEGKLAPTTFSWSTLHADLETARQDRVQFGPLSLLFQGARARWLRLLPGEESRPSSYLALGTEAEDDGPPVLDQLLPALSSIRSDSLCALIGDPVEGSPGDWWHSLYARAQGRQRRYLKIPVSRQELHEALPVLHALGFHGLSVTSPLKELVATAPGVRASSLTAGNTLLRLDEGWELRDSDSAGMEAVLEGLTRRGIRPGPVLLLGRGGVREAVERALRRRGWPPPLVLSFRNLPGSLPSHVRLVINASGRAWTTEDPSLSCDVWVDLQYRTGSRHDEVVMEEGGWVFYRAQAELQARWWDAAEHGSAEIG